MKQNRFFLLIAALFVFVCVPYSSSAITLDEIVAKNIEAKGGQKALDELKGLKSEGSMTMMGMEVPFTTFNKQPNKIRVEMSIQGMNIVMAYDGVQGYAVNPMMGADPVVLQGAQLDQIKSQADADGLLVNWKTKGYTLEYIGTADVDGNTVYNVKVKKGSGEVVVLSIDAITYLEAQIATEVEQEGTKQTVLVKLADYKAVGAIKVPHKVTSESQGQIVMSLQLTKVEAIPNISDELFTLKKSK